VKALLWSNSDGRSILSRSILVWKIKFNNKPELEGIGEFIIEYTFSGF
jgi:hypothetical protein